MASTETILDQLNGFDRTTADMTDIWNDVILILPDYDPIATSQAAARDARFREDRSEGFATKDGRVFVIGHDDVWSEDEIRES